MNPDAPARPRVWGMLAEFERPDELVAAAHRAREAGYRRMDAYTPFPIHGLSEALGFRPSKLPLLVLAGGIITLAADTGTSQIVNSYASGIGFGGDGDSDASGSTTVPTMTR